MLKEMCVSYDMLDAVKLILCSLSRLKLEISNMISDSAALNVSFVYFSVILFYYFCLTLMWIVFYLLTE